MNIRTKYEAWWLSLENASISRGIINLKTRKYGGPTVNEFEFQI